jgi:uncharacterized protein
MTAPAISQKSLPEGDVQSCAAPDDGKAGCRHCAITALGFARRENRCVAAHLAPHRQFCVREAVHQDGRMSGNTVVLTMLSHMKPSIAFQAHRDAIRRIVEDHRARNPRVFGSVLQGSDTEDSDLDLLIDPTPETTLFNIGTIRHELLQLLGVPVDVRTPQALPEKFRAAVLAEAVPV